ncbi:AAA family ATPase [Streptosporangium sp. NPDC051022]|uniref:nucleotide-binding protein n=1 Tax=Streptosporangium sp. NPDC051022 TaxID=3155752 RepID=UPI003428FBC0
MDDAVISPYPKDPWSSVPAEPEATSSSLFRTAADPSHNLAGTSTAVTDPPIEEADAADWMEVSGPASSFTVPPAPPATGASTRDEAFLAPLKPLPRQEADDTGGYGTGRFTEPETRTPRLDPDPVPHPEPAVHATHTEPAARTTSVEPVVHAAPTEPDPAYTDPEPESGSRSEQSRGLFEHRPIDALETFPLINVEPRDLEAPSSQNTSPGLRLSYGQDTSPGLQTPHSQDPSPASHTSPGPDTAPSSHASPGPESSRGSESSHGRGASRGPELEPFMPTAPQLKTPAFGGTASGSDRPAVGGAEREHDRLTSTDADSGRDRFASVTGESDRFAPAAGDSGRDGSAPTGGDSGHERTASGHERAASGHERAAFGGAAQERDRSVFEAAEPPTTGAPLRQAPERAEGPGHSETAERFDRPERTEPEVAEPFRKPGSFGTGTPQQTASPQPAPSPEQAAPGTSGTSGAFGSAPSTTAGGTPSASTAGNAQAGTGTGAGSGAFGRDWDRSFSPSRSDREASFTSERDTAFAPGPDRSFAAERPPAPEREAPFAQGGDTTEPVREPYQPRRRHSTPPPAFSAPSRQPSGARPSADSLDPDSLLRGRRNAPSGGWRGLIYRASAGLIKPGESPEARRRRELIARARTPVATGHHRVAVLSLKGGVGKTTTTVGLGATLAQARGDRVIAVDANPDRGTLSDKVELETSATVRDLLNERQQIRRYVDIRAFTSQAPSRLEILASDRDPSVSEAFSASDYQAVAQVLENFYSICITDCGTGLLHSAMSGVLGLADQLVLVSSPSVDGARAASATLDWLEAHHYEELVRSATVVLCSVRPRSKSTVDLDRLEAHFAARCRAVIRVPYDPHLEEGAEMELDRLQPATRDSYLRLAASVGDGFAVQEP